MRTKLLLNRKKCVTLLVVELLSYLCCVPNLFAKWIAGFCNQSKIQVFSLINFQWLDRFGIRTNEINITCYAPGNSAQLTEKHELIYIPMYTDILNVESSLRYIPIAQYAVSIVMPPKTLFNAFSHSSIRIHSFIHSLVHFYKPVFIARIIQLHTKVHCNTPDKISHSRRASQPNKTHNSLITDPVLSLLGIFLTRQEIERKRRANFYSLYHAASHALIS